MNEGIYKHIFNEILKITDDGFIVIDKNGKVININDQYCNYLGKTKKEIIGSPIKSFISNSKMLDIIKNKYSEESAVHKFLDGQTKDNSNNILLVNRSCVCNENNEIVAGVAQVKFKLQTLDSAQKLIKEYSKLQYYKEEYNKKYSNNYSFKNMIGVDENFIKVKNKAIKFSKTDFPVLLTGETGTGKEVFAQAIHNSSQRSNNPLVSINCAAIPDELIESELFGYEEGSFTGAKKGGKLGRFELADGGTIFLDEIGDMPYKMQSKLLRVLEENEIEKVGSTKTKKVDVRIISATRQNLEDMINAGTFREDLYFRINVLNIELTPLRERKKDIPLFINSILNKLNLKYKTLVKISKETLECFLSYNWSGNVRELENVIKSAYASCENSTIEISDLPTKIVISNNSNISPTENRKILKNKMEKYEYLIITDSLKKHNWNVSSTSDYLGIHRSLLYKKINKYDIDLSNNN